MVMEGKIENNAFNIELKLVLLTIVFDDNFHGKMSQQSHCTSSCYCNVREYRRMCLRLTWSEYLGALKGQGETGNILQLWCYQVINNVQFILKLVKN
jgi:hypothetical protein